MEMKLVLFVALASLAAVYAQGPTTAECHPGAWAYTPDAEPPHYLPGQLCACPDWDAEGYGNGEDRRRRSAGNWGSLLTEPGELCGCMPHCEDCATDVWECDECEAGYFFNGTYCVECSEYCINCTDEETCYECESGYFVNDDQTCEECMENCISCVDNSTCDECDTSYYYSETDAACVECMDGCEVCSDGTDCEECSEGYTYDDSVPECTQEAGDGDPCTPEQWREIGCQIHANKKICYIEGGRPVCDKCKGREDRNTEKNACNCKRKWVRGPSGECDQKAPRK